jgi:hypothetical protein
MSGLANHTAQELAEMLDSALGFVHQKDALTELVHRAEERDRFKRYHDEIREEYMEVEAEHDRLLAVAEAAKDFLNVYDQAAPSVQEIEALRAALVALEEK